MISLKEDLERRKSPGKTVSAPVISPSDVNNTIDYQRDLKNGKNLLDVIQQYNNPYSYEQELKQAERARKTGVFLDTLSLAGDALTSALGRRQFNAQPHASVAPSSYIDRLKQAKVGQLVNSQNILRDAAVRQYSLDREDDRYNQSQARLERNFKADQAYKSAQFNRQLVNDQALADYRDRQLKGQEEGRRQSKAIADRNYGLAKTKADVDREYKTTRLEQMNKSGKSNDQDYIIGANGKKTAYPKAMRSAVSAFLYKRMQDIVNSKDSNNRKIEDIQMSFGEGGDQATKMEAIVKRRIADFPELQEELEGILRQESGSKTIGWGDDKDGKKIGW